MDDNRRSDFYNARLRLRARFLCPDIITFSFSDIVGGDPGSNLPASPKKPRFGSAVRAIFFLEGLFFIASN
jgi:hypothetical protein